jgi:hypothetical protein
MRIMLECSCIDERMIFGADVCAIRIHAASSTRILLRDQPPMTSLDVLRVPNPRLNQNVHMETLVCVQMSILLTRSENQILVLETLLKRLVQVCVHTQDKRLAKELKLMDFTRLVRNSPQICCVNSEGGAVLGCAGNLQWTARFLLLVCCRECLRFPFRWFLRARSLRSHCPPLQLRMLGQFTCFYSFYVQCKVVSIEVVIVVSLGVGSLICWCEMGEGTVHEHHVTYLTKHTQRPKAFSATSPCLSRSLSVSAGQAMHSGNGQTGQQKQGTSCKLPTMYNIVKF